MLAFFSIALAMFSISLFYLIKHRSRILIYRNELIGIIILLFFGVLLAYLMTLIMPNFFWVWWFIFMPMSFYFLLRLVNKSERSFRLTLFFWLLFFAVNIFFTFFLIDQADRQIGEPLIGLAFFPLLIILAVTFPVTLFAGLISGTRKLILLTVEVLLLPALMIPLIFALRKLFP